MASLDIHIHTDAMFQWGKVSDLAGKAIAITTNEAPVDTLGNGQPVEPVEPNALAMIDGDGETHVFVFTEAGKQKLVAKLTGGVIVP